MIYKASDSVDWCYGIHIYLEKRASKRPENPVLDKARFILDLPRKLKKVDVVKNCTFSRAQLERAEESTSVRRSRGFYLFITRAETTKRSLSTSLDSLTIRAQWFLI